MEAASTGHVDVVRVLLNHRAGVHHTHLEQNDNNNDSQTNTIDEMHTGIDFHSSISTATVTNQWECIFV